MVLKLRDLFLILFLLTSVLLNFNFVSADFSNCWDENSINGGTKTSCNNEGCLWASNDASEVGSVTDLYDMFCGGDTYDSYCCFPNECWQYDSTNETYCEDSALTGLNCTWDQFMQIYHPNGSLMYSGGCMNDWSSGGGDWGGMDDGCWQYDGDKATCTSGANAGKCSWSPNGANENPWCFIKTLGDAQMKNLLATSIDVA